MSNQMWAPSASRCRTSLLWAVLLVCWAGALCNTCNPGVLSPGWIYPLNDISVEENKPVEMLCVLNTSHPNGQGGSWKNLSFYIDSTLVEEPFVHRYNETAIKLHIDKAQLSPNAPPNDFYVVSCRQNKESGICFRHVYVGFPPQPVTDFQCTSYNWERLECTWIEPYNPIHTAYALSYQLVLRARQTHRSVMKCPSGQRAFLSKSSAPGASSTRSASGEPGSCTWSESSSPPYMPSTRAFNFTMNISNELGSRSQYLGLVDNYAIVIPGEMKELKVFAVAAYSATVEWKVPFNLQLFPPGLEFRVAYRILSSWADSTEYHEVPEASQIPWSASSTKYRFNVSLPNAYTDYNVTIWARSAAANKSDEGMWSAPATIGLRTESARPCSAPNTTEGAFEVIGSRMEERTVTVRWSRLPLQCENGPGASYRVVLHDASGNAIAEKNVSSSTTHAQFGGLAREKAYEFRILAFNDAWYSKNYSQLFLNAASKMPTPPENVMRISYNATFFEIQWTRSLPSQSVSLSAFRPDEAFNYPPYITDYTVFWCQSERDSPVECKGPLYWQTVPASQLALNVTVSTAENYQFAVDANQGSVSSGLVWSTCIVSANGNGSQIKQIEVLSATSSSLDLAWSLPCSVQNGIVTGFKIYYCPVLEDYYEYEVPECRDDAGETEVGPSVNRYRLDGLDAYTMYKIVMSVMTRLGEGQSSAPVLNRTAEGRPSAPLDLQTLDLTNETVTIAWRKPDLPNGPGPYYVILGAGREVSTSGFKYTVTDLQSYTDYAIRLKACNSPDLCSVDSTPLPVKTKIGVPSEPILTTVKQNADNASLIEIKWQHPIKPAGPISMTVIRIAGNDANETYYAEGNTTERLVDAASMCQPGQSLMVRLQAVNRDDGVELYGPWSSEVEYPCLREGLSAAQIAGISFGAAVLVLLVVGVVFAGRRVQELRTKAEKTEVVLPWEKSGNMGGGGAEMASPGGGLKQVVTHQKDVGGIGRASIASSKANNFYGQLGGAPAVIPFKKQQSAHQAPQPADGECTADRESRSSGHSSAPDSLSWHRASRSELSSSDSGAEFEAPNSPSPDTFVSPPLDAFAKPIARSSQNLPEAEFAQYPARDAHGSSAPDLAQPAVTPYVSVGMVSPAGLAPSHSVGYVTLGQQARPSPAASPGASPNASPNLSVGSNESLIGKSEREARQTVKIIPLKRNSAGGSGGCVDACIVEPVCELRASASPGYVSFKSQEPTETDRTAGVGQVSAPSSNGYVTLGATGAGAAPSSATSTHYVKMGPQSNHSLSYV